MEYLLKPYEHQLQAIERSKTEKSMALFWEMGCGKTGAMINILRYKYCLAEKVERTLIFCPKIVCKNWKREFAIHSAINQGLIYVLDEPGKKKIKQMVEAVNYGGIVITNYESLLNKEMNKLLHMFDAKYLVCDESHLCKSHTSKRSKETAKLSRSCKHVYLLTGTPILKDSRDIFQQYKILDGGETFGTKFHQFQGKYFEDKNAPWKGRPGYFPKWEPIKRLDKKLNKLISSKSMSMKKEEALDLPPLIKKKFYIQLSGEQNKIYNQMEKNFIAFVKENDETKAVTAELAITKALRLLQICSGYVKTEEGKEIAFDHNPKIEATRDLLSQIIPGHKCIIWHSYNHDYIAIAKLLDDMGISYRLLNGSTKDKDKQKAIDDFQNDERVRVIVANRAAGGIGVNLTAASYSIVYSRNFSLGEDKQSESRNHRGGSEVHERIVRVDLVASGTIEERVIEAIDMKQKISDAIIDWGKNE